MWQACTALYKCQFLSHVRRQTTKMHAHILWFFGVSYILPRQHFSKTYCCFRFLQIRVSNFQMHLEGSPRAICNMSTTEHTVTFSAHTFYEKNSYILFSKYDNNLSTMEDYVLPSDGHEVSSDNSMSVYTDSDDRVDSGCRRKWPFCWPNLCICT